MTKYGTNSTLCLAYRVYRRTVLRNLSFVVWTFFLALSHAFAQDTPNAFLGLSVENDVLGRPDKNSDRNYTMGIQVDWASETLGDSALGVLLIPSRAMGRIPLLGWFDLGPDIDKNNATTPVELAFGAVVYTPNDLTDNQPIPTDRPYSSLFYVTLSETRANATHTKSVDISSTLGVLGLGIADDVQTFIHEYITPDSPEPQGWDNQISDGGEPTFQFNAFGKTKLDPNHNECGQDKECFQLWAGAGYGLGYRTHATTQLGMALSLIQPIERKFYQHRLAGVPMANTGVKSQSAIPKDNETYRRGINGLWPHESYLYATMTGSYIAYDVSLQGQFRDNPDGVERSSLEIEHFRYFGAIGVNLTWDRFSLGYQYKYESPELTSISEQHEYGLLFFQLIF